MHGRSLKLKNKKNQQVLTVHLPAFLSADKFLDLFSSEWGVVEILHGNVYDFILLT